MRSIREVKVAIVHDLLVEHGGAEEVFLKFLKIFPQADVYTSLVYPECWIYKRIKNKIKKAFIVSKYTKGFSSLLKPLVFVYWANLDLSRYSLVLSSSGSFSSKAVVTSSSTLHVCYCHTPPKYLYQEYAEMDINFPLLRPFKYLLYSFLRKADLSASRRPDIIVANSKEVQQRIRRYYHRESLVIYPPVLVPKEPPRRDNIRDYYIYIGRLYRQKGLNLLVKAFNENKKNLVVIGEGMQMKHLKDGSKRNIKYLGYVSERKKINYLKKAKGFVFPTIDEDCGMVPVEAMAYGVPVVAFKSGGVIETVIDEKTGIFFEQHTTAALNKALERFETMSFDPEDCYLQAKKFSENIFEEKVRKLIQRYLK